MTRVEDNWDEIKEIISEEMDKAFINFNLDYFKGGMASVGVVSDNIIEKIKLAARGRENEKVA